MRLLKLFETRTTAKPVELVEKDMLRMGMSSYDVDLDAEDDRVHLRLLQQGMDIAEVIYEDGEVIWIHVEPFFRNQGLGSAMVKYLQDHGYPVVMPDARTGDGKAFFGKLADRGKLDEIQDIGDFADEEGMARDTRDIDLSRYEFWTHLHAGVDLHMSPNGSEFAFVKNGKPVGHVSATYSVDDHIGRCFRIGLIWLSPDLRRQGIGLAFYRYLLDTRRIAVMSDDHQSDSAQIIWERLVHTYEAAVYQYGELPRPIKTGRDYLDAYDDSDDGEYKQLVVFPQKRTAPLLAEDAGEFDWSKPTTFYRGVVDLAHAEKPFTGTRLGVPTFTDNWHIANLYATDANNLLDKGKSDQVYAYRLNIKNPIHLNEGREDVTEANNILRKLGITDVDQAWVAFQSLYKAMTKAKENTWRCDGDTFLSDGAPYQVEGIDDENGFVFPDRTYKSIKDVFYEHWAHNWPGLYCHSYNLANSTTFQKMVGQAGFDGIVMYGYNSTPEYADDEDIMTGTSYDGLNVMEWRALHPSQIEFLGPAPKGAMHESSDPMLDQLYAAIYRDKAFARETSTPIEEFIEMVEDEYPEMCWWEPDQDVDDVMASSDFWAGFKTWLAKRYAYVMRNLGAELASYPVTVIRQMIVAPTWNPAIHGVGLYWAIPGVNISPFNASSDTTGKQRIQMTATIQKSDINWFDTVRSRLDFMNGDVESEIQLKPKTMVKVLSIDDTLRTSANQPRIPISVGAGVYPTTGAIHESADPMFDQLYAAIYRDKAFARETSTPIDDFIQFVENDYPDMCWWEPGQDVDDVMASSEFWDGFKTWLAKRYSYVMNTLNTEMGSYPATVVRAMTVTKGWDPKRHGVGLYWAVPGSEIHAFSGRDGPGYQDIMLTAVIQKSDINWFDTIRSRMDFRNGDEEGEIQLFPRTMVKVISIENNGPSYGNNDGHEELSVVPGVYPASTGATAFTESRGWRFVKQPTLMEGPPVPLRVTPTMISRARDNKCQVIVEMPIDEFLRMTTSDEDTRRQIQNKAHSIIDYNRWAKMGHDRNYHKAVNDRLRADWNPEDGEFQKDYGNDLMPFLTIRLNATGSTGQVVGHEGRHRGSAAARAGAKTMMVALRIYPGQDMFPGIYSPDYFVTAEHVPARITGQYTADRFSTTGWKVIDGDMQKRTRDRIIRD